MTEKKKNVVIIGSGITGLSAAAVLKNHKVNAKIYEKSDRPGGLCKSFCMHDEWYDIGGHCSFAKDPFVRNLLEHNVEFHSSLAEAANYKKGTWVRHPVQINLQPLDTKEKIRIIKDYIDRPHYDNIENYDQWLRMQYGNYFAENYPFYYTEKYWTVEPKMLETKWVGVRMYTPSIEEVLYGAFETDTPNVHYSNGIRYPLEGGFEQFLKEMETVADIEYNKELKQIVTNKKQLIFTDGSSCEYEHIIATAPLPEVVKAISEAPESVRKAAENLNHTSLVLVSLCIKGTTKIPVSAFYVYDKEFLPSRVYSTNAYSGKHDNYTALQAEVYFSKFKPMDMTLEEIEKKVIEQLIEMGVVDKEQVVESDVRYEKYANIIFTHDIYDNRDIVHEYLDKKDICYAGRFGEWDYLWSDQSILSGKRVAEEILKKHNK